MLSKMWAPLAGLVGAVLILTGCATPSVNPVWSAERGISEPAIVGEWRPTKDGDKTTYTIAVKGDAYRMLARSIDPKEPEEWEFEVRLAKLGEGKFADVSAAPESREQVSKRWGPLFVPTHLFARYALEGDALRVWLVRREWLESSKLPQTTLSKDVSLITAPTSELQKFLESSVGKPQAFGDVIELRRALP
jgi:hypothetical protein